MVMYKPLYTVTDATKELHISKHKVYQLIHEGKLPVLRVYEDGDMAISGKDLELFIDSRQRLEPKSKPAETHTEERDIDSELLNGLYAGA